MAININPNRINVGAGSTARSDVRSGQQQAEGNNEIVIPRRASVGIIPEPESMQTMIRSAVSSMRSGVFWDRGTILNILA